MLFVIQFSLSPILLQNALIVFHYHCAVGKSKKAGEPKLAPISNMELKIDKKHEYDHQGRYVSNETLAEDLPKYSGAKCGSSTSLDEDGKITAVEVCRYIHTAPYAPLNYCNLICG